MLLKCPLAPLVLAFILGPAMEENLRRATLISNGSIDIFLSPICLSLLVMAGVFLALILLPSFRRIRTVAVEE